MRISKWLTILLQVTLFEAFVGDVMEGDPDMKDWSDWSFHLEGKGVIDANFAHIVTHVNISDLAVYIAQCRVLKDMLYERLHDPVLAKIPQLEFIYEAVDDDFTHMEAKYTKVLQFYLHRIPNSTIGQPNHRPKRQLLLALGALTLGMFGGATLFGLMENGKIEALQKGLTDVRFRQQKMVHMIEGLDSNVRANRAKLNKVYKTVIRIEEAVTGNTLAIDYSLLTIYIEHVINSLDHKLDDYVSAIKSASIHRLDFAVIEHKDAVEGLEQAKTLAAAHGFELIIDDPQQLFQCEASIIFDTDGFHIVTHVPLVQPDLILDLWRYTGFPLRIGDSYGNRKFYQIQPTNMILGYNPTSGLYTELNTLDLTLCHKQNSYFLCPSITSLRTVSSPSCLLSLYLGYFEQALNMCKTRLTLNPEDFILRLGDQSVYKTYTKNTELATYRLQCRNGTNNINPLKTFDKVEVPKGCVAKLPQFHLFPATDLYADVPIRTYDGRIRRWKKWPILNSTEVQEFLKSFDNDTYISLDVDDLRLVKAPYPDLDNSWSWPMLALAGLSGVSFLAVFVFGFIGCRNYFRFRKQMLGHGGAVNINLGHELEPLARQNTKCRCTCDCKGPAPRRRNRTRPPPPPPSVDDIEEANEPEA